MNGEELGRYAVGLSLDLRDLSSRVGNVETLLGRVEKSIDSLDEKGKRAGFGWLKGAAQLEFVKTAVHGVVSAVELIPAVLERSTRMFDDTVGSAARYADTLQNQAALVGTSVREMESLTAGLEVVSGSGAGAEAVLMRVSRAIGAATGGGMRIPPKQAFKELGIELTEGGNRARPFGELMDDIARKFAEMPEGPRRTALAMAIFGGQAARMLELFRELGASGKTWQQTLEDLGLTIDTKLMDAAGALDNQLNTLSAQGDVFFRVIGSEAAPAFAPLLQQLIEARKQLIDWAKDNKDGVQDVAGTIAATASEIVRRIQDMADAFAESGIDVEDEFIDAIDLSVAALNRLLVVVSYVVRGMTTLRGIVLAATELPSGLDAMANAWTEYTAGGFEAADMLERLAEKNEEARLKTDQGNTTFRSQRAELASLTDEYERTRLGVAGLDTGPNLSAPLARAREIIEAMGDGYLRLNENARRYYEQLGLHSPTVPAAAAEDERKPGAVLPQFNAQQVEQATKAIRQAIEAAEQQRAAILGGAQATIAATIASEQFAAASEVERQRLEQKLLSLDALQRALTTTTEHLKEFQAQDKQSVVDRDRSLALRREAIEASLTQAKASHDEQAILTQTAALSAVSAEQRVNVERDAIGHLEALMADLADARSDAAKATVTAAIEQGRIISGVGEEQVANLRAQLADELALRRDQFEQVKAIAQQQAANAQEAAQREVDKLRGAVIDFKQITSSTLDDMFEGAILGTQKMSKVWDSMWLSMARTGLSTLKDMVLNKITAFDDPMIVNFTELPGKLSAGFSVIKRLMRSIFGDVVGDQEQQAGDAAQRAAAAAQAAVNVGGQAPVPYAAPATAPNLATGVAAALGQPGPVEVPYAPPGAVAPEPTQASPGVFSRLFGGLFGGGSAPKTSPGSPGLPSSISSMTVSAGTVVVNGGGAPGLPPAAGAPGSPEASAPGAPAAAEAPAAPAGGGAASQGAFGAAMSEMGAKISLSVEGVGQTLQGVGKLLLQPLVLLPNILTRGFNESSRTFIKGSSDATKEISKGTSQTVGGLAGLGQSVGNALSAIGGLIGGKAGAILSMIGEVISAIIAMMVAVVTATYAFKSVLGFGGATGGYLDGDTFVRPPGATGADEPGGFPMRVHAGEAIINPRATEWLGGRDAAMALNAGRIPAAMMKRFAAMAPNGGVAQVAVPIPTLGGAGSSLTQMIGGETSYHVHPGAIVVQVPEGTNGERFGQDLMRGLIARFQR